ncbi:hypothetical protein [Streptomyces sp. NPDC093991]|uniref:hypothetical protein n=1 Tax=unclassified Streptomyces TaxID=2593676 RepID=UPI00343424DE
MATAWGDTGGGEFEVWQYGPADLWRQVQDVWEEYTALDAPAAGEFGLTLPPGGQRVWLRDPGHVIG